MTVRRRARIESLERRTHLHAAIFHALPPELAAIAANEHIPASTLVQYMPELAGKDLWDASTFNPSGSNNPDDYLYDPHFIEDDRPIDQQHGDTALPPPGGPELADALPDMVPLQNWASGSFSPFIDTTEQPGRVLFKFANAIGNQGAGPASLLSANSGTPPAGSGITSWINPDGTQNVLQRIYSYNSATNSYTLSRYAPGGRFIWHSAHSHFHMEGYAEYKLMRRVSTNPDVYEQVMRNDGTEAVGEKVGFCLINVSTFTLPNGQSSSTLPGANGSGQPSPGCGFAQGVSVGRADVYGSGYDGQWIDVTGVPNGNYFISMTVDAKNAVQESDESNNTMYVPVTLNANPGPGAIQPDRFDLPANGGPNNTFATATNLGELGVAVEAGLTAHAGVDFDYYRFTATSSGTYNVQLAFTDGNMDLYVYDANQALLGQATTAVDANGTQALETVSVNFTAGATYYVMARGALISGASYEGTSNNYSLRTFVLPTITPSTPDASAGELGTSSGMIRVARNGPDASPLTVLLNIGGTATRGVDYNIFQDGVLIPTGTNQVFISTDNLTANLEIVPVDDGVVETDETVTITALSSTAYVLGAGGTQTVTISDTPPQVQSSQFGYLTSPFTLDFSFSLDVSASLGVADLTVINRATNQPVAVTGLEYASRENRGVFSFGGVLPDGNYRATLSAAGVTHALGAPLPGDVVVDFFVFAGDFNHDRTVNIGDFALLAGNFNLPGDFGDGDANYDGTVDIGDFSLLAARFNSSLPEPGARVSTSLASGTKPASALPAFNKPTFGAVQIGSAADRSGLVESAQLI